jgi:protein-disulfide isomerase
MSTLKVPVTPKDHVQGNERAEVVLVEYGDYECPHCGLAYHVVKRVQRHFGAQLGFVFRNFPLNEIHPHAESAAESAEFAATNDRFWEMHDGIFENQSALDVPMLLELADSFNLSALDLREALQVGAFSSRVREDFLGGVRSGVNGTPTFFINGHRHDGPFEFRDLVAAIEARLSVPR